MMRLEEQAQRLIENSYYVDSAHAAPRHAPLEGEVQADVCIVGGGLAGSLRIDEADNRIAAVAQDADSGLGVERIVAIDEDGKRSSGHEDAPGGLLLE